MGDEPVAVVITPESCDPVVPEPPSRFLLMDWAKLANASSPRAGPFEQASPTPPSPTTTTTTTTILLEKNVLGKAC